MSERLPENHSPGQEDASDINICNWAPINNLPPDHPEHLRKTHSEIVSSNSQQPPDQLDHHYHHQGQHNTLPSISPYSTDVYGQQVASTAASVDTMTTRVRTDPAPVVIRLADSNNNSLHGRNTDMTSHHLARLYPLYQLLNRAAAVLKIFHNQLRTTPEYQILPPLL